MPAVDLLVEVLPRAPQDLGGVEAQIGRILEIDRQPLVGIPGPVIAQGEGDHFKLARQAHLGDILCGAWIPCGPRDTDRRKAVALLKVWGHGAQLLFGCQVTGARGRSDRTRLKVREIVVGCRRAKLSLRAEVPHTGKLQRRERLVVCRKGLFLQSKPTCRYRNLTPSVFRAMRIPR